MKKYTNDELRQEYWKYIIENEDKKRLTYEAEIEKSEYEKFCKARSIGDKGTENVMYDKGIDLAIAFEQSGFISGFKKALEMMKNDR